MHPEIKENIEEKLRLVRAEISNDLEQNIRIMLADHSATGQLRSGNTIRRTMDFIASGNQKMYRSLIDHLTTLNISFSPTLETDIQELARTAQDL